jgi:predicted RNA methylase
MFNKDFYPTPEEVALKMLSGYDLQGKIILEPSVGKGDLVDAINSFGPSQVIGCELNEDLRTIAATKCQIIEHNFLKLDAARISHINFIVMNPPFSKGAEHILHAWEIAPAGCKIIALCNIETVKRTYHRDRAELQQLVEDYGRFEDLGDCFSNAERKTKVEVALVHLQKPAASYEQEFEGFFMFEEEEKGTEGIMPYNSIREIVNRYIGAVKLYDQMIEVGMQMNDLIDSFKRWEYDNGKELDVFLCDAESKHSKRISFKKALQKRAWNMVFSKLNMDKYSTRGLKNDMNKFVEEQTQIPFTMRNIYKMLEIIVGTTDSRMDQAILEAFEGITKHHDQNRHHVEGWKTNSHYVVGKKFIFPYGCSNRWDKKIEINEVETLTDFEKALCFVTGENYDQIYGIGSFRHHQDMYAGQWYHTHFFKVKGFKKRTLHCEFLDMEVWAQFNQRVAKLKGYPLFEAKEQTAYQNRQTGRAESRKRTASPSYKQPEEQLTLIED